MNKFKFATTGLLIILCLTLGATINFGQTTAFTFQGKLTDGGMAPNATYDMIFRLFDDSTAGTQIGSSVNNPTVQSVNGIFTVQLDFGAAAFSGADRYLEINIRPAGSSGGYTQLLPRQRITSAPQSIRSLNATNASQLGGIAAGNYLQTDGSGANLTNLNASSITSGSLADTQLSANVAFRSQANTFTGNQIVNGNLSQTGTTADLNLTNGFLARGTSGTGSIPATGAGVRMMFYSNKAAFRAGNATGAQWDDANTGIFSFATGNSTTASGFSSTAIGNNTTASGNYSTAMGIGTTASGGNASTALGSNTTASGNASTALGFNTTASGSNSTAMGNFASTNNKDGSFVYGDDSNGTAVNATAGNQFVVRAQNVWFGTNNSVTSTANRFIETSTGAYLSTSGVWTNNSSVNLKTNFAALDSRDVLRKVLGLKIQSWNYKVDSPNIRHIGVMAQDFYKVFKVGADDEHLTPVDTAGVEMLAIQGLNEELNERATRLETENDSLRQQLKQQQTQIDRQQTAIDALVKTVCAANAPASVCRQEDK